MSNVREPRAVAPPNPHRSELILPEWEGFGRRLTSRGAFEQLDDDPRKNYGIAGVELSFTLVGPDDAVTWELLTDCFLPHTLGRLRVEGHRLGNTAGPVKWCHRHPQDGSVASEVECPYLGEKCHTDIGFLVGDAVYAAWAYGGFDGVWGKLRELL